MREILFRGKSVKTNEWVQGDLFHHGRQVFIATNNRNTEILPETLGQSTGLTDRNGVKIFEGDILKHLGGLFLVEYDENLARFLVKKPNGVFIPTVFNDCEIVGNVHDNPELLRGK